jgi:hypothetical protein
MHVRFQDGIQDHYPIWENVVLLCAASVEDAYAAAEIRGRRYQDDDGLRWDNRPAAWVFSGIRKVIECEDSRERPAQDTELTYSQFRVESKEQLEKFVGGDVVAVLYEE